MAQTVTFELSALNNIPGVSGVEDVTFSVPTLEDIKEGVADALLVGEDVLADAKAAVTDELDDLIDAQGLLLDLLNEIDEQREPGDPLLRALAEAVAVEVVEQLAGPDTDIGNLEEEIARRVVEEVGQVDLDDATVEIEGSLFSIAQDFTDLIAEALSEADLVDVPQFPTLEEIRGIVSEESPDPPEVSVPTAEDIGQAVDVGLPEGLSDVADAQLLTDPDQFIDDQIDRVTDGLVSEDARQELADALNGGP
jgi:hypothetical protein